MSSLDEWEQAKRDASLGVQMRLASAEGKSSWGGGNGAGGVKSDRKAWSDAGTAVSRLRGNAKTALGGLEHGQKGASVKGGVLSAAAQREVYESWKRYLEAVSGRCGAIQEVLEKAGKMQHQNDGEISKEFDSMRGRYKDTPAIGGQEGK